MRHATAIIVLGGKDKIVGVDTTVRDRELLFGDLSAREPVGVTKEPDIEAIVALEPGRHLHPSRAPGPFGRKSFRRRSP